ncbi:MAG: class I adenylate-forming enzyme family protein [Hyphomicrobiaceae bacterium]
MSHNEIPTLGFSGPLPPLKFNMVQYCLEAHALSQPDKPALVVLRQGHQTSDEEIWTYAELQRAVLNVAGGLKAAGLSPGDRLLIHLENTSAYAILFFGAIAGGFIPLPTSEHLTETEVGFLAQDATPALIATGATKSNTQLGSIITPHDLARMIADGPMGAYHDTAADDPAYLIYTSGTTAKPKGVLHAHRAAWGRRPMYDGWYGITTDDRMLHAGAFNWTYTLGTGLIDPWANCATAYVVTGKREGASWPELIRKSRATLFAAVPGVFRQILKYGELKTHGATKPFPELKHGLMAGEAPPANLFSDWKRQTGCGLYEALGMSEISTYISTSPSIKPKPGTIGKVQKGRCVSILPEDDDESPTPLPAHEPGLLAVHRTDPGLMLGYWNRPDEDRQVTRGDWFIGGDRASIDQDGYVTHLGRANDVMKALGYRVAPQEVEAVLLTHDDVIETACAEISVRSDVRVIVAFIVLRAQANCTSETLAAYAGKHLASYKTPRAYVFIDKLPRTPNGKVKRNALAKVYETQAHEN